METDRGICELYKSGTVGPCLLEDDMEMLMIKKINFDEIQCSNEPFAIINKYLYTFEDSFIFFST